MLQSRCRGNGEGHATRAIDYYLKTFYLFLETTTTDTKLINSISLVTSKLYRRTFCT